MLTLTNSQAKYIVDKLRECERELGRLESPYVDRNDVEFAISILLDHPGYQEPARRGSLTSNEPI